MKTINISLVFLFSYVLLVSCVQESNTKRSKTISPNNMNSESTYGETYGTQYCSGPPSVNCNVINGTGSQSRSCTNGKWEVDTYCKVVRCDNGYSSLNNLCVPNMCDGIVTGTEQEKSCSIVNGTGSEKRLCINGVWSVVTSCEIKSCNIGHYQSGNSCEPNMCDGIQSGTDQVRSCSISNGTGSETRRCTTGSWSVIKPCEVKSCSLGYYKSGNTCESNRCDGITTGTSQKRSCSITNGLGSETRSCTNGNWHTT